MYFTLVVAAVGKKIMASHHLVVAQEAMGVVVQAAQKITMMLPLAQQTQAAVAVAVEEKVIETVLVVALEL